MARGIIDVRKMTRGITFWREDIIKYSPSEHDGASLSRFVRELLHKSLAHKTLPENDLKKLNEQIAKARAEKVRKTNRIRMAVRTAGMTIPLKVRRSAEFVKA